MRTREIVWSEIMYHILETGRTIPLSPDLLMEYVHPDDRAAVHSGIAQVFSGSTPSDISYRLRMPDGRYRWVLARHVADRDADGRIVAFHGTLQDITAPKEAELKLKQYSDHLEELVEAKVREISDSQTATIYALVKLSESRDDDTGEHIERTPQYCRVLARTLRDRSPYGTQLDDACIANLAKASPLHDIGKVGIPGRILLKPGRLTPDEFEIMKTHVTISYRTLASVETLYPANAFLRIGMEIARYHHEKWDGSGYREGLSGNRIPLSARIMAVSDVYDALRSRRVYKEPFSHEASLQILRDGGGRHFDPLLIAALAYCQEDFRALIDHAPQRG